MNGCRPNALSVQLFGEAFSAVSRPGKDKYLRPVSLFDEVDEQVSFFRALNRVDNLLNYFDRGVPRGDLDHLGIMEKSVGKLSDLATVGGGEKKVLTAFGKKFKDALDVVDEAHVQHTVRFVEDKNFDFPEIDAPLAVEVEQAPRAGNENVDSVAKSVFLRCDADSSKNDRGLEVEVLSVSDDALADLCSEFTGRREDEGTWLFFR